MSNQLVSVITVTKGTKDYISSCLDSVKEQSYSKVETIVIDNSLGRNFSQKIRIRYPSVKIHSAPEPLSYCRALNKGIEMSSGAFILCLNDDVILDKRFIEEALRGFSIDKRVGMVSGKILRFDKKTFDSTGLFLSLWRTAKERGYGCKDKGQFEKEGYVFGVNGAVAFYRKLALEQVKMALEYFDSDFGFFYEDLDIAWRLQNFSWKGYYIPSAIAYHLRGGTARQLKGINKSPARHYLSDELHFDLVKNRYLTIIKNESAFGFLLSFIFTIPYDFIQWIYILFFRPKIIRIILSNLKYLESALGKRRLIKDKIFP